MWIRFSKANHVDVGQSVIAALKTVGQSLVVAAEQMRNGGLQVVHMDLVFHNVETEFVGRTIFLRLAPATHEHRS